MVLSKAHDKMSPMNKTITVEAVVYRDIEIVWNAWVSPEHIVHWLHAEDTWECPKADADVKVGGHFSSTMRAKDNSVSFDFSGVYTAVEEGAHLAYTMDGEDARTVTVDFIPGDGGVRVIETFEMENENSEEMQREGWQSIMNNFKAYVEGTQ
jgi:uncharacterized protein YndB with AHSA1/START domain